MTDFEKMVLKHEQTLYGETGKNGLRGQFKTLDEKMDRINSKLTQAGGIVIGLQLASGIIMALIQLAK
jgi:hypothetical protein